MDTSLDFSTYITERTRGFVGREWVFQALDAWLQDPKGSRVFLLTGEPGCGKTAIAARLAQFSQGACTPPEGLAAVAPGFLSAIHFCRARYISWISPHSFAESVALQLAGRYSTTFAKALAEGRGGDQIRIDVQQTAGEVIGQQIGVLIQHLDTCRASAQDAFLRSVCAPLEAHCRQRPQDQVVLLVDALDETLAYHGEVGIVTLLAQAQDLPAGVRFVLVSGPDREVLQPLEDYHPQVCWLSQGEGLAHSLNDVRLLVLEALAQRPALHEQLTANFQVAALVAAVQAKSAGNLLYTTHLLDMLAAEGSPISAALLDRLPAGLDEIYLGSLRRFPKKEWETRHGPILGTLAVARDALSEAQLANVVGVRRSEMRRHLGPLRPFLDVDEALPPSQRTYSLYHHSFAELLLHEDRAGDDFWCEAEAQHERIAGYYLRAHRDNWQACDEYGLDNLAVHLLESGQLDQLQSLITEEWSRARSRYGFEADARLAWPDRETRIRHFRQATRDRDWKAAWMLFAWDLHDAAVGDIARNRLDDAAAKLTEAAPAAARAAQLAQAAYPDASTDPDYLNAVSLRGYVATKLAQIDERRGHEAEQAAHLQEAATFLEQVLDLDPENAGALNEWGNVQFSLGDADKAIAAHERAIELYAWYTAAYWDLALTLQHKMDADPERADQWLGKAIAAWEGAHLLIPYDSGFSEADLETARQKLQRLYMFRFRSRWMDRDIAGAEADVTAAITRNPDEAGLYYYRGRARVLLEKFPGAECDMTIALDKGLDDAEIYYYRGRARVGQEKYPEAERDLTIAIDKGMDRVDIYSYRGTARVQQEKYQEAERDLTIAIDKGMDSAIVYFARSTARVAQEKYQEAERDMTIAIDKGMDHAVVYEARSTARAQLGDHAGAEADAAAARERSQEDGSG